MSTHCAACTPLPPPTTTTTTNTHARACRHTTPHAAPRPTAHQGPPFQGWGKPGVVKDSSRSVFVRNLPFECTYEDLAAFFSQAGQVRECVWACAAQAAATGSRGGARRAHVWGACSGGGVVVAICACVVWGGVFLCVPGCRRALRLQAAQCRAAARTHARACALHARHTCSHTCHTCVRSRTSAARRSPTAAAHSPGATCSSQV